MIYVALCFAAAVIAVTLLGFYLKPATDGRTWKFCPLCASRLHVGDADGKTRVKCTRCKFVNWDNPKGVAVAVIPTGDGILLIKRGIAPKIGMYALPGGFIDAGEDPEMAVKREAKEETGLVVEVDRLLMTFNVPQANQNLFFYLTKPVTQTPVIDGKEVTDYLVVNKDNMPTEIAFSSHVDAINLWLNLNAK